MGFLLIVAAVTGLAVFVRRDGPPLGAPTRKWITVFAVVALIAGVACRLYEFDRSLWIDEFGTLWTVESTLAEAANRAVTFHGQSPLYYVAIWPLVHAFGESEIVLRLPSLACGAVAALLIYRTASALASVEAGLVAASLAWIAPATMEAGVNARPYAAATMFAAMACHGFALTALEGRRRHRWSFVAGGAGLFLTQYVSSVIMLGLGVAYLTFPMLRVRYRLAQFATDVGLQACIALVAVPQLVTLWGRRSGLDWIGPPDYLVVVGVLAPFLVPVVATALTGARAEGPTGRSIERGLLLAVAFQVGALTLLALAGTNLLAPRYLMIVSAPASVLAGVALARQRSPAALVGVTFAVMLTASASVLSWRTNGLLTTVPQQDWRAAVSALDAEMRRAPRALVLYRPGFVEQDPSRSASPAVFAPLRSPGRPMPAWSVLPLTFSWWSPSRGPYFDGNLTARLASADTFFLLNSGTTPKTGDYATLFLEWIDFRFPREFRRQAVVPLVGVDLLRFDRVARSDR